MFIENFLQKLKTLGVNTKDLGLVKLCNQYANDPKRLLNAMYSLREALHEKRVNSPNAFIKAAIRQQWKPYNIRYSIDVIAS